VGIQEKYLPSATVEILSLSAGQLKLRVLVSGTLRVWVEKDGKKELRSMTTSQPGIITITK